MIRRIHWTPEEYEEVLATAEALLKKQIVFSKTDALLRANILLPEARQRPLKEQASAMVSLRKKLYERMNNKNKEQPQESIKEPPPESPRQQQMIPTIADEVSLDRIVDVFVRSCVNLISAKFEAQLRERMHQLLKEKTVEKTTATPAPLTRVLIVGLNTIQQEEIRRDFGQLFDLRFFKEGTIHQLVAKIPNCDIIIAMTDWIGHDHFSAIQQRAKQYYPVSGHLMNLRNKLEEIYAYL